MFVGGRAALDDGGLGRESIAFNLRRLFGSRYSLRALRQGVANNEQREMGNGVKDRDSLFYADPRRENRTPATANWQTEAVV